MKTRETTLASAKSFLHVIAFFATTPVLAQLSFALQKNNYLTGGMNRHPLSQQNYYLPATSISEQGVTASMFLFSSSMIGSNDIVEVSNYKNKPVTADNLFPGLTSGKFNVENVLISFRPTSFAYPQNPGEDIGLAEYPVEQLMLYAAVLKKYAIKNGCDTTYAFLSNMGMLRNKRRFFVINLVTMKIEQSGLVAQGRGVGPTRFDKQYSNTKGSKCTSLGRYKIINKYKGEYGEAYRMLGLDSSNYNAFKRNIVLHSMGCIPDAEENNMPVCISEGCPAVSISFLSSLSKIIDSRKKPVLLWIFDSNLEEIVIKQKSTSNTTVQDICCDEETSYHRCSIHQPGNSHPEL
jgi:hypothetical protein